MVREQWDHPYKEGSSLFRFHISVANIVQSSVPKKGMYVIPHDMTTIPKKLCVFHTFVFTVRGMEGSAKLRDSHGSLPIFPSQS